VASIRAGVEAFQKMAMRRFGNFIAAYRRLARITAEAEMREVLGESAARSEDLLTRFQGRRDQLLAIELIERENTPLVGYLSAGEIVAEHRRAAFLRDRLPAPAELPAADWAAYEAGAIAQALPEEQRPLRTIITNYRTGHAGAALGQFADHLGAVIPRLAEREGVLHAVRERATRNQDVYLTWDHMDVYFATSMRKRWEFEDLYDFVNGLMDHPELLPLKLRHFDPTQSFTPHRINKGLVESLMLKRAKCTVYSVQDTDTLGKDSEMAATLAQGKPVIAYVPRIEAEPRVAQLLAEDPVTIQERLRFVIYADDYFAASLSAEDLAFVRGFHALEAFEQGRVWKSVPDEPTVSAFRAAHRADLERLCGIVAGSEARIYDKRAKTLIETHPLAVQVNLETGVANGVLVVRAVDDCARLLRRILTNSMEFDLEEDQRALMWYLRERISRCVFRVVSKDRKLTNCFWNFYLQQEKP
jgi:hypothetical protein